MSKRVLFVSIAFPPKLDPECIQAGRYFSYLSACQDVVVDVVTSSNPTLFMPTDVTLQKYANVSGQLIEIRIFESRYVNYILRKFFPRILSRPDAKMTFHWQWKSVLKRLKEVPDIIYSRSNPLSSAVMGLKLSSAYMRPWILHLSDPWTENALHPISEKEIAYHEKMEKDCLKQATIVSFTSEKTVKLYKAKYPQWEHKMVVFPNVYDPNILLASLGQPASSVKTILYTGGLANTRTAKSFLQALHLAVPNTPKGVKGLNVLLAGEIDRNNQRILEEFSAPYIRHMGRISYEDAAALQRTADLLVVIDSIIEDPEKAVFFPSKLLDYARSGKPILAITGTGSATEEFVQNHGGVCFDHRMVNELAHWLQMYLEGNITFEVQPVNELYSAQVQSLRLLETIKAITS